MYNLITLAILVFLFIATLVYLQREQARRDQAEKERFREFVLAVRSKTITEYNESIVDDGELPVDESDDLVDLDQVDPEMLLRAIKQDDDK